MVYKYVSIKNILESIYRDNGLAEEVNFLDIVEWCGEALDSIGAFSQYQQKTAEAELCDFRVVLPPDFHRMLGLAFGQWPMREASSSFGNLIPTTETSTGFVFNNEVKDLPQSVLTGVDSYTYTINDNFIISNLQSGTITLSYLAIPVDCDGFPLIPDNYYYQKALKSYVIYMLDRIGWRTGDVNDKVYAESKNDWQWYITAARSASNMPNISGMENFKNSWLRLYPQINQFDTFFKDLGTQERLKRRS